MVLVKGLYITADRYFLILLVPAIALGVWRRYLVDWVPFIGLMLVYEYVRGWAWLVNDTWWHRAPFVTPMIDVDRFLFFGHVPNEVVQRALWTGHLTWFDHVVGSFDHAHFFVPPTLLFLIWLERRDLFYRCALTLVVVSFAGAIVFFLFPAAPPWLASQLHHGIDVVRIGAIEGDSNGLPQGRSILTRRLHVNPVAAVPSLHAAYALLTFMFAYAWRRRVGLVFALYPLTMWFTIIYLGDHYVSDILAGVAFALVGWWAVGRLPWFRPKEAPA
jgi:hypothetical protein